MVIMIVTEQYRMNGRQFFQGNSRRDDPFRTFALLGTDMFTPDWIGEQL